MIGFTDVPAPRGDDICQSAMTKLKVLSGHIGLTVTVHHKNLTHFFPLREIYSFFFCFFESIT